MRISLGSVSLAFACALFGVSGSVLADCVDNWRECKGKPWVDGEVMETPLGSKWWPHPMWGPDDEAGSTNWYTKPEVIQRAMASATQGVVYKIGHAYTSRMPLFGARKFVLRIPGSPTGGAFGANKVIWHDDFLSTEVGQVGTQFDGLGHIGVQIGDAGDKNQMRYYNGFTEAEMGSPYGLTKNGVEKLHPIVARGILIDVAASKGIESMNKGDVISMADVMAALEAQGMKDFKFLEGDAVLFRTGWEMHWTEPGVYNDGCPGIGMEVARWLAEEVKAGVTGADTWPVEAVPDPDPACVFCVHTFLQTRHGIVNQENLKLSELSRDKVYQFLYMYSPTPIEGATGSMGAPIAIK